MGRVVMVGRGPTGAGGLVLSILVILTTEGCRAQKGWCLTAAVTMAVAGFNQSPAVVVTKCEHSRSDVQFIIIHGTPRLRAVCVGYVEFWFTALLESLVKLNSANRFYETEIMEVTILLLIVYLAHL